MYEELKTLFQTFLDSELGTEYRKRILEMQQCMDGRQSYRLVIDLHDFHQFDANVTETFIRCPLQFLAPWTHALHAWISAREGAQARESKGRLMLDQMSNRGEALAARFHLGFTGGSGTLHATPRSLRACHIGRLVSVEGIVVRCLHTHPKVLRTVHRCEHSKTRTERVFRDSSDLDLWMGPHTRRAQNTVDLPTLPTVSAEYMNTFGLSSHTVDCVAVFKDHQCITLQETPEKAPHGQLPRSVRWQRLCALCKIVHRRLAWHCNTLCWFRHIANMKVPSYNRLISC